MYGTESVLPTLTLRVSDRSITDIDVGVYSELLARVEA